MVVEVVESAAQDTNLGDGGGSWPESEVEETNLGDGRGSWTTRAGAGCWVLWAMRLGYPACARAFPGILCVCRCWCRGFCHVWCLTA